MAGNTPDNPTKAPKASENVPRQKGSKSGVMKPMSGTGNKKPGSAKPSGSSSANPKNQGQTVNGSPNK